MTNKVKVPEISGRLVVEISTMVSGYNYTQNTKLIQLPLGFCSLHSPHISTLNQKRKTKLLCVLNFFSKVYVYLE